MEKKEDESEKNAHYLRREFSYSKYEQTLIASRRCRRDKIGAKVANGVLTVTLPKINRQEQKRLEDNRGGISPTLISNKKSFSYIHSGKAIIEF